LKGGTSGGRRGARLGRSRRPSYLAGEGHAAAARALDRPSGSVGAERQFSVKVGTIFEESPISLAKWLPAMWLLANCKNGISSYELARDLGVTQRTAWFMLHRIRYAMQTSSLVKLGGGGKTVEVDETWIGGSARKMNAKQRARHPGKGKKGSYVVSGKAIVLGMLERGGRVAAKVVPNARRNTLLPEVVKHVAPWTEVHTDEHAAYFGLVGPRYEHKIVNHAVTYVDGKVHTNGVENFWSLLKRGIRGTYISVELFHLFRYLDEQAFRFNERDGTDGERFAEVLGSVAGRRLTYKQLTAQAGT
jgi:transposase-like protein